MYKKIEQLCKERGISIYRLAKESGVKQTTLHQLKVRGGNLSLPNAIKIADYFGIGLLELASK